MVNKQHLTWTQIEDLAIKLADRLPRGYDVMLVITRGGMVPACIISERLNLRNILVAAVLFYTAQERTLDKPIFLQFPADPLLNGKRVLIVDDVWDSGRTIMAVRERVRESPAAYPRPPCCTSSPAAPRSWTPDPTSTSTRPTPGSSTRGTSARPACQRACSSRSPKPIHFEVPRLRRRRGTLRLACRV